MKNRRYGQTYWTPVKATAPQRCSPGDRDLRSTVGQRCSRTRNRTRVMSQLREETQRQTCPVTGQHDALLAQRDEHSVLHTTKIQCQ